MRLGAANPKKEKEAGKAAAGKEGKDSGKVTSLTLKRFYRPEDISKDLAYKSSSYHEVGGLLVLFAQQGLVYDSESHMCFLHQRVVCPVCR